MKGNLINLNVNPCKMCMPMGAVSALCGIRACMSILHGSQGCATYIRRHMATHYNEPVDIASSSLTEEGTVFGGEANLLKGLKNLIELYEPEVIGVCTTCLAETIGEDVGAIVKKFYAQNPDTNVKIISVASPGYGGTQNEGWFAALRSILEQTEQDAAPNGRINVVTPMISPADTRWLKGFLAETDLEYILLPDLSDNLDGATEARYKRLKKGGASIFDIAKMAGAWLTIEFSEFADEKQSPAAYLREAYGVPCLRLPLPVGVRGTDRLIDALAAAGGTASEETEKARGRYLDAMADAHKYCAKARAAIFGEPDFVAAVTRLCCENGALPVLAATGSVSPKLREALSAETEACRAFRFADEISVLDDSDFTAIERVCRERGVNLLIGSSDGRRIAHRLKLPLIRCAFPIHDHVGGQRVRMLGFEGSLNLLDQTANAMLERIETRFRGELYDRFFKAGAGPVDPAAGPAPEVAEAGRSVGAIHAGAADRSEGAIHAGAAGRSEGAIHAGAAGRSEAHPCFDENARKNARLHLPVAPKCNIRCNYCLRRFDCVNESRPGVSSEILTPAEAFERYVAMKRAMPNLTTVGIAGPGDALANFEETRETLRLIREYDKDVILCVATNGLLLPQYVPELKALRVSHVTVTVNAIDPAVEAKICEYIHYMGETYTGAAGAAILLANRLAGIAMLRAADIACKVNCVALKGVNDAHIPAVAKKAAELGAVMTNIMPHIPVKGSAFEDLDRLTPGELAALRALCGAHIKQMEHCRQCRADAAGTIDEDPAARRRKTAAPAGAAKDVGAAGARTGGGGDRKGRIAVFTDDGSRLCDFFDAERFLIFERGGLGWESVCERPFAKLAPAAPAATRKAAESLLPLIEGCGVLAGGALLGIPFSVFDRAGLKIFEIGEISDDLFDGVIAELRDAGDAGDAREAAMRNAGPTESSAPGVYFLDLVALQRAHPEISGKKAMADFLDHTPFLELHLICRHVPPWIENSGRYDVQAHGSADGAVRAVITRRC